MGYPPFFPHYFPRLKLFHMKNTDNVVQTVYYLRLFIFGFSIAYKQKRKKKIFHRD